MVTVSILINGQPILTRSARNQNEHSPDGKTKYITDAGDIIWHQPEMDNGAIELAKAMLDSIKMENI